MDRSLSFDERHLSYYKHYEIGYEDTTGDIYVSKSLGDMRYEHVQMPTIEEAFDYIDSLYEKS